MTWLFWIGLILIALLVARRRLLLTEAFFVVLASKMGTCRVVDLYEPMRKTLGREINPWALYALIDNLEKKGYIETWVADGNAIRRHSPDRRLRIVNTWEHQYCSS